jgi:hypothetical protein
MQASQCRAAALPEYIFHIHIVNLWSSDLLLQSAVVETSAEQHHAVLVPKIRSNMQSYAEQHQGTAVSTTLVSMLLLRYGLSSQHRCARGSPQLRPAALQAGPTP